MPDKSHVSLEQSFCPICLEVKNTGNILLDTRVRNGELMKSLERTTVTGFGLCNECETKRLEGFIVLIEIDASKSDPPPFTLSNVWRTGHVVHIREPLFQVLFPNMKTREPDTNELVPLVLVELGVVAALQAMAAQHIGMEMQTEPGHDTQP